MDRFYLSPDQWVKSPSLTGDEAHHCFRVMRKQVGDEILVFDGLGKEGQARISAVSKSEVALEILSEREVDPQSPEIEIAVGIPKGKTFDLILQKAVEMGVTRIQPLVTEQGNVRFKGGEGIAKQGKWQRAVMEACKQCGQNYLPEVGEPIELEAYLSQRDAGVPGYVAALTAETKTFREALEPAGEAKKVALLIGPEGDFSSGEYEQAFAAGFAPVSLGNLVLRTETAVFWMVAAVRFQFQS